MEYFTVKTILELTPFSKPTVLKDLKLTPCESKNIEGSTKPVKHYKFDDLPQRYKDKLQELGIKPKDEIKENKINNISTANFTKKYIK